MEIKELKERDRVYWFRRKQTGGRIQGAFFPAVVMELKKKRVCIVAEISEGQYLTTLVQPDNLYRKPGFI